MLNIDQENILKDINKFITSDSKEFIIDGSGGTGKSYLISELLKDKDKYIHDYDDIIITSTTNKACTALQEYLGTDVSTIHSYLGLSVRENYSNGSVELKPNGRWSVKDNIILIIDECSMIDSVLFDYIHKGLCNSKIIYVGDMYQLAPIKNSISPVYEQGIEIHSLTINMRQENQELIDICNMAKEAVRNNTPLDIKYNSVINKANEEDFINSFKNVSNTRVLNYTNKSVDVYNNYIRSYVKTNQDLYSTNEVYILNNVCHTNGNTIFGHTEDEVIIKDLDTTELTLEVNNVGILKYVDCVLYNLSTGRELNAKLMLDRQAYKDCLNRLAKLKDWTSYFYLKNNIPDLISKDACTVHKAQGSSLDDVYIDLTDLSKCTVPSTFYRLFYVAVSRARKRIFFFGSLKEKYGVIHEDSTI